MGAGEAVSVTCEPIFMLMWICSQEYGHRVRLASHANFKDFVKTGGLEFYPLGGDPKVLAECTSLFPF